MSNTKTLFVQFGGMRAVFASGRGKDIMPTPKSSAGCEPISTNDYESQSLRVELRRCASAILMSL